MPDVKLDYLDPKQTYIDQTGRPTPQFVIFWMRFIDAIKAAFAGLAAAEADITALETDVAAVKAVPFVTIGNSATTSTERALAATSPIVLTDGGANSSATLSHATSGVSAGSYGSASAIPILTVDARGHVTAASTVAISTASYIPLVTGAEPVELVSDGAGHLVLITYP